MWIHAVHTAHLVIASEWALRYLSFVFNFVILTILLFIYLLFYYLFTYYFIIYLLIILLFIYLLFYYTACYFYGFTALTQPHAYNGIHLVKTLHIKASSINSNDSNTLLGLERSLRVHQLSTDGSMSNQHNYCRTGNLCVWLICEFLRILEKKIFSQESIFTKLYHKLKRKIVLTKTSCSTVSHSIILSNNAIQ